MENPADNERITPAKTEHNIPAKNELIGSEDSDSVSDRQSARNTQQETNWLKNVRKLESESVKITKINNAAMNGVDVKIEAKIGHVKEESESESVKFVPDTAVGHMKKNEQKQNFSGSESVQNNADVAVGQGNSTLENVTQTQTQTQTQNSKKSRFESLRVCVDETVTESESLVKTGGTNQGPCLPGGVHEQLNQGTSGRSNKPLPCKKEAGSKCGIPQTQTQTQTQTQANKREPRAKSVKKDKDDIYLYSSPTTSKARRAANEQLRLMQVKSGGRGGADHDVYTSGQIKVVAGKGTPPRGLGDKAGRKVKVGGRMTSEEIRKQKLKRQEEVMRVCVCMCVCVCVCVCVRVCIYIYIYIYIYI